MTVVFFIFRSKHAAYADQFASGR